MAYINSELGIPVSGIHHGLNFVNASGGVRGRRRAVKGALLISSPVLGAIFVSLSQSDKKRYKEAMGSISSPPSNLIRNYYSSTKSLFPYSQGMTSDQLASLIDILNNEYNRWDTDRDSKASKVAKNRKPLNKGENKQTLAELAAVRAWMQATNDYRAEVVKAYDKAVAIEEKQASQEQPTSQQQGSNPTPTPPIGGTPASLPPPIIDGGTPASLSPTTDGGTSGGANTSTDKNKKIMLYSVGGLVVIGALVYYFKK